MITPPPTRAIHNWYSRNKRPTRVAEAPSMRKIRLNPRTKNRECVNAVRRADVPPDCRSSIPIPLTNDRYEGTSGNTHGDKKLNIPALNATRTPISNSFTGSPVRGVPTQTAIAVSVLSEGNVSNRNTGSGSAPTTSRHRSTDPKIGRCRGSRRSPSRR